MSDLEPYTSGYMKPPKKNRFKPGKSGNSKGRPKQPPTPYKALQKALKRKVTVAGEDRKIRLDEALIRRLRDLALSGDRRAIALQQKIVEMSGANTPVNTGADEWSARDSLLEFFRNNPKTTSEKEDDNVE